MEIRFTQRHVTILNFALVAAIAYVLALTVNDIVKRTMTPESEAVAVGSSGPRRSAGLKQRASYEPIVKRDIFNLVPQENAPAPVVVEDLHLKLLGTSLLSKSKPYAIIEDQGGNESLYQVGEEIPDAGRLVSVEVNRAIIERGGRRGALDIPTSDITQAEPSRLGMKMALPRGIPTGRGGPGLRVPHRTPRTEDDSDDSAKIEIKKLGPGKFEASRDEVAKTMQNPAQLFQQMRALPHFVNGKTDGFSISNVAPGSVFAQLGLQNGDLLTEINGQPVTNPMQAMGLMQAVHSLPAIDLVVSRNGSPTSLHLDLR
ncbi:MAG TPA: type II secretion system protein GspC [Candidatus Acidoferrales bacterium]|nr:type II secretion system protein GspC [Candidatus Acidoferrales bacterium]